MGYHIMGKCFNPVDSASSLGIQIAEYFNWKKYVFSLVKKSKITIK